MDIKTENVEKFTVLKSLKKYKICDAFAGYSHSLFQTFNGMVFACGDNYNGNLLLRSGPSEDDVDVPTATSVTSGASSCIAGWNLSVVFIDCDLPPNNPNKLVTNLKNNLTPVEIKAIQNLVENEEKEIKKAEEVDKHEKRKIKELESTVAAQKEKIKELEQQILKMKHENSNHNYSDETDVDIKILDPETIRNLRTIREISKGEGSKVYEVAKEESFVLKVVKVKNWNDEKQLKLLKQSEILRSTNHPSFLKMFGFCINEGSLSVLLEFCQMNMQQAIKKNHLSKVQIL